MGEKWIIEDGNGVRYGKAVYPTNQDALADIPNVFKRLEESGVPSPQLPSLSVKQILES